MYPGLVELSFFVYTFEKIKWFVKFYNFDFFKFIYIET